MGAGPMMGQGPVETDPVLPEGGHSRLAVALEELLEEEGVRAFKCQLRVRLVIGPTAIAVEPVLGLGVRVDRYLRTPPGEP